MAYKKFLEEIETLKNRDKERIRIQKIFQALQNSRSNISSDNIFNNKRKLNERLVKLDKKINIVEFIDDLGDLLEENKLPLEKYFNLVQIIIDQINLILTKKNNLLDIYNYTYDDLNYNEKINIDNYLKSMNQIFYKKLIPDDLQEISDNIYDNFKNIYLPDEEMKNNIKDLQVIKTNMKDFIKKSMNIYFY